jgi:hypothetical protein
VTTGSPPLSVRAVTLSTGRVSAMAEPHGSEAWAPFDGSRVVRLRQTIQQFGPAKLPRRSPLAKARSRCSSCRSGRWRSGAPRRSAPGWWSCGRCCRLRLTFGACIEQHMTGARRSPTTCLVLVLAPSTFRTTRSLALVVPKPVQGWSVDLSSLPSPDVISHSLSPTRRKELRLRNRFSIALCGLSEPP